MECEKYILHDPPFNDSDSDRDGIKKIKAQYEKHGVNMNVLLHHYDIAFRHCVEDGKTDVERINPYKDVYGRSLHVDVEAGIHTDEILFSKGAWLIRGCLPSDVVRTLFYPPSQNDYGYECDFLLPVFISEIALEDNVMIINPSPDVICKFESECTNRGLNNRRIYIIRDTTVAGLYSYEFTRFNAAATFLTINEISDLTDINRVLLFSRGLGLNELTILLDRISHCSSENAEVMLSMPNQAIDSKTDTELKETLFTSIMINEMVVIPRQITKTTFRKKILVCGRKKAGGTNPKDSIWISEACYCEDTSELVVNRKICCLLANDILTKQSTIKKLIADVKSDSSEKKGSIRHRDQCVFFSKEIAVNYSIQYRDHKYSPRAYYKCQYKQKKSGIKRTPEISQGLRGKTEEEAFGNLEQIPFREECYDIIRKDILHYYEGRTKELTLKTLWVCCYAQLATKKTYNHEKATELFGYATNRLIANIVPTSAHEIQFIMAMNQAFGTSDAKEEIPYASWRPLMMILDTAVEEGFIPYNPIAHLKEELTNRQTKRQRQVTNALTKKIFTETETEKILSYLCGKTKNTDGGFTQRYILDPMALAVLIKLCTGMNDDEVCGLSWSTIRKISYLDAYYFAVGRFVDTDGNVKKEKQAKNKYRRIPLPKVLTVVLNERKKYLKGLGIKDEHLSRMSIVSDVPCDIDSFVQDEKSVMYCPTTELRKYCQRIMVSAEREERKFVLIDGKKIKEKDLNKYTGDYFRTNFTAKANRLAVMTNGEIAYILGNSPKDTFSLHYCDYSNEFVQYAMSLKLDRWLCHYKSFRDILKRNKVIRYGKNQMLNSEGQTKIVGGPFQAESTAVDILVLDAEKENSDISFEIESEHGFCGQAAIVRP